MTTSNIYSCFTATYINNSAVTLSDAFIPVLCVCAVVGGGGVVVGGGGS